MQGKMDARLQDAIDCGVSVDEVRVATQLCQRFLDKFKEPSGQAAHPLSLGEVADKVNVFAGTAGKWGQVIFGSSLASIDLETRVYPITDLDLGRMRWACEQLTKVHDVNPMLGTVVVSGDLIDVSEFKGFRKVERDTEIDVLCLALFWHKEDDGILQSLAEESRNMVLSAEVCGTGVHLTVERFLRAEQEESKRRVMGQSAYRKSLALKDLVSEAHPIRSGRSDAELAEHVLTQRKELSQWKKDTCSRYLQVAERMTPTSIQQIMMRWEFHFRRDTLVDSISVLRACVAAAPTTEELTYLLETLFYEQVCKMRHTFKHRTRQGGDVVHVMRGILLRLALYRYCRQAFPKHEDSTKVFGTWEWFNMKYGMTVHGKIPDKEAHKDQDEDEVQDEEMGEQAEPGVSTRYASKTALLDLLNAVALNKHEAGFISLAKEMGNIGTLDLCKEGMKTIQAKITLIMQEYQRDFPPVSAEVYTSGPVTITSDSGGSVSVKVSSAIESQSEYEVKLAEHLSACHKAEADAVRQYINSRVVIVVSKCESSELAKHLKKVPLLNEPGRKLFKFDTLVHEPMNWDKLKAHKRAFPVSGKVTMVLNGSGGDDDNDTLAPLKEVYTQFRSMQDKVSEDVVAVIIPGAATDSPDNPALTRAFASLRMLQPKHVGPKIGTVPLEQTEILRQMQPRGSAWKRKLENHLMFAYQSAPGGGLNSRKRMKYLTGGDTYINNWPTPALAVTQMAKCPAKTHDDIFKDEMAIESGDEDNTAGAQASTLTNDTVIPFPREHPPCLTQEMIHVFGADLLVDLTPGSGQSPMAAILENIKAVVICKNTAHKTFVLETLSDLVKFHKLVRHTPPVKPAELVAWETARASTRLAMHSKPLQAPVAPTATGSVVPAGPSLVPALCTSPAKHATTPKAKVPTTPVAPSPTMAAFGKSVL